MKVRFLFLIAVCSSLGSLRGAQSDSPHSGRRRRRLRKVFRKWRSTRLQAFLAQNPPAAEQAAARGKLVEALVRVGQPSEALKLFSDDPGLTNDTEATFWRAQALAALERWAEALPLYEKVAADAQSLQRSEAIFGEAEALRGLGRKEEAMRLFSSLENTPRWSTRAKLSVAQLLIERGDLAAADRLLRETKPQRATERS